MEKTELKEQVVVWGWNGFGQLSLSGYSGEDAKYSPVYAENRSFSVRQVAMGLTHTLALSNKRTIYSTGKNENGRLGRSKSKMYGFSEVEIPREFTKLRVSRVSCGGAHSAFVSDRGELFTFGKGDSGQLGHGQYGDELGPRKVVHLSDISLVACGSDHTVVASNDGTIYAMGANGTFQLGLPDLQVDKVNLPTINALVNPPLGHLEFRYSNIDSIACGQGYTVIVKQGHLYSWGMNSEGQCGFPKKQTTIVKSPTRVIVYPDENSTKKNDFVFVQVSCGIEHTMALTNEGILFGFGSSKYGQISQGYSGLVDIDTSTPIRIGESLYNEFVTQVACGSYHCLALSEDGHMYSWGLNDFGQCGNGSSSEKNVVIPYRIRIPDGNPIAQISAGGRSSMAIRYAPSSIVVSASKYPVDIMALYTRANGNLETYSDCQIQFDEAQVKAHRIILNRSFLFKEYIPLNESPGATVSAKDLNLLSIFGHTKSEYNAMMLSLYRDNIYDTTNTISNHLYSFVNSSVFSDIKIRVKGEDGSFSIFHAHKCILATRSQKFRSLFESKFGDVVQGEINIDGVSPGIYYTFLNYLYTDKLGLNEENVIELYDLAHKELQERMIELIESYLFNNIDDDNVSSMFQVCSSLNMDTPSPLEEQCVYYIAKNFKTVSQTESFIELPVELKQKISLHSSQSSRPGDDRSKKSCIIN